MLPIRIQILARYCGLSYAGTSISISGGVRIVEIVLFSLFTVHMKLIYLSLNEVKAINNLA
jgi:hypothetical protein